MGTPKPFRNQRPAVLIASLIVVLFSALGLLLVAFGWLGQATPTPPPATDTDTATTLAAVVTEAVFDRKAMLRNIGYGVILPFHAQLVEQTTRLKTVVTDFSNSPTQQNLDAVQEAWKVTSFPWEHCRLFDFRRVLAFHSAINKPPANTEFIEEFIGGDRVLDEAFINGIGSTSKGLPAIEYLVFTLDGDDISILTRFGSDPAGRRMQYMVALAQHLDTSARALYAIWSPEGENYTESFVNADQDGGDLYGSINMLVNIINVSVDRIVQGAFAVREQADAGGEQQLKLSEGVLSGYGVQQMIANLESMRAVFTGSSDYAPPAGLNAYLNFLDSRVYADVWLPNAVITQIDDVIEKLKAVQKQMDGDTSIASDTVTLTYRSLKTLLTTIRVEVSTHFGVTITFNDTDGD